MVGLTFFFVVILELHLSMKTIYALKTKFNSFSFFILSFMAFINHTDAINKIKIYHINTLSFNLGSYILPAPYTHAVMTTDTIKPVINLLNKHFFELKCGQEFFDTIIRLEDNVNTDLEMRLNLTITTTLPKNRNGNYFCNCNGPYKNYYLVRDLAGNISDTATRTIYCVPINSIHENNEMFEMLSVYPNPGHGLIHFKMIENISDDVELTVFDMFGKVIFFKTMKGYNLQSEELDLQAQPKGIYLLKVETGQKVFIKKVQIN